MSSLQPLRLLPIRFFAVPALLEWLCYAGIGTLAGFFAGLLGIGGGAITGPLLIFVYVGMLGLSADYAPHMAVATASGVIALTAPMSAAVHARQCNVDWRLALIISASAMVGAFAGANGAILVSGEVLKFLLVIFLLVNTVSMLVPPRVDGRINKTCRLPFYELLSISCVIGALSAMLGIGGGTLTVPYLHRRGVLIRRAIGTSAFVGFPLALAASMGYAWGGSKVPGLPDNSWGYVHLPALGGIAVFSIASAYCGAKLTVNLPANVLRKIFAVMTVVIALRLFWSVIAA